MAIEKNTWQVIQEYNGVSKVLFPLIKKNVTMLVWLWIKNWNGKLHKDIIILNKFALVWDEDSKWWKELNPFEEYGKLLKVEYMVPNEKDEVARFYAENNCDYWPYFNSFKLIINNENITLSLEEEKDYFSTVTTKQNRVPSVGMLELDYRKEFVKEFINSSIGNKERYIDHLGDFRFMDKGDKSGNASLVEENLKTYKEYERLLLLEQEFEKLSLESFWEKYSDEYKFDSGLEEYKKSLKQQFSLELSLEEVNF